MRESLSPICAVADVAKSEDGVSVVLPGRVVRDEVVESREIAAMSHHFGGLGEFGVYPTAPRRLREIVRLAKHSQPLSVLIRVDFTGHIAQLPGPVERGEIRLVFGERAARSEVRIEYDTERVDRRYGVVKQLVSSAGKVIGVEDGHPVTEVRVFRSFVA